MNRESYEGLMETCAESLQGCYGRWYYDWYLQQSDEVKDELCNELEKNDVNDMLGFIMFMER